jgi:phage tail-like protein
MTLTVMPQALVPSEDPDRPRHVRLDFRRDSRFWWAAGLDHLEQAPHDGLRLVALPGNGRPLSEPDGTFGGLTEPTGMAVDRWGRIYLADPVRCLVQVFDPCCGAFEPLPCFGGCGSAPRRLREPRGLAATHSGLLYVVDRGNRRVQVLWVKGPTLARILGPLDAQGRRVWPRPEVAAAGCPALETYPAGTWDPYGVAVDGHGRAFVSDREGGLVHRFDAAGRWLGASDGSGPGGPALVRPTHLAVDLDDRVYVAQEGAPWVAVLDADGVFLGRADPPEWLADRFCPGPVATDPSGNLYIADRVTRRLFAYHCRSKPGTAVDFSVSPCAINAPVAGLAFDPSGSPLVLDARAGTLVCMDGPAAFAGEGAFTSAALDSSRAGCVWHRVALEGTLPLDSSVSVQTFTSDELQDDQEIADLATQRWTSAQAWTGPDGGPWDCLVLGVPGRYCWLRLTFAGSGTVTPLLRTARVHFPRRSSIEFLPAVYRSGSSGGRFLERFLSIFDEILGGTEGLVDEFHCWLDPRSTPAGRQAGAAAAVPSGRAADFLAWLASWVGLLLEGTWSEAQRRRMVARAAHLYAWRGTLDGLREAVQLIAGIDPSTALGARVPAILEDFSLRRLLMVGGATLGSQSTLWGKRIVDRLELGEHSTIGEFVITAVNDPLRDPFHRYAHRFSVFLPAWTGRTPDQQRMVERIVDLSRPAHAQARVEFVEPRLRVGVQASVGMDTVIGRYPAGVAAGEARLAVDAVLQDRPDEPDHPSFSVGTRSQLGTAVL